MKKGYESKKLTLLCVARFDYGVNTVNVQAGALDYLGNTIDGSELKK